MDKTGFTSWAQVELPAPARTLQRLCKHFSHKVNAHWDENQGRIDFAEGQCTLQVEQSVLHLHCRAPTNEWLAEIEQTMERHLPQMSSLPADAAPLNWQR